MTDENETYQLGEEAIQATMKANGVLKEGYENVFANLAVISTDVGTMETVNNGSKLFDDRTAFTFDVAETKFLEGKSYTYAGLAEGAFKVNKGGYVFLIIPDGSAYATVRNNAINGGWKVLFNSWNNTGTMSEKMCYYVKWCEAGESYSYGKINVAVALDSWNENNMQEAITSNNLLKEEKPVDVFANLASISTSTGTIRKVANGSDLFDDRVGRNFLFNTNKLPFLEGKSYVYTGIAKGSFSVDREGYVILMMAGGTTAYDTRRAAAEADGWKMVIQTKNCLGSLGDTTYYYVKWCEAGESYAYGQFNIAFAQAE